MTSQPVSSIFFSVLHISLGLGELQACPFPDVVFPPLPPVSYTHLLQRPCYQRGNPCQDPAGNWTTRRPDHRKETQTAVVWSCLPFIRSGRNHPARHSERGKKTRQTEEGVGRQHLGMDRPGVCQVAEGSGEKGKMEETGSAAAKSSVVP